MSEREFDVIVLEQVGTQESSLQSIWAKNMVMMNQ